MQLSISSSTRVLAVILFVSGVSFVQARAENLTLEEVIVTAQKREQNIQDVPVSVVAISGDFLTRQGIADLDDFSSFVPNLEISQSTDVRIRIRGLGSGTNRGFEQSVGMYVDGIYLARDRYYRGPLFDLERIEVLRGPQGILFGKNTIAGAINISSARPALQPQGSLLFKVGDYDLLEARAMISGPLTNGLTGRLALITSSEEGYVENSMGGDDGPETENKALRVSTQWAPSEKWLIDLKLETGSYDVLGHSIQVSHSGPYTDLLTAYDSGIESGIDKQGSYDTTFGKHSLSTDTRNVALGVEYSLDDHVLTAITGYIDYDATDNLGVDFIPVPLANQWRDEQHEQFSQELRLASAGGDTLDYIGGIYYQHSRLEYGTQTRVDLNPLVGYETPFSIPFGSNFDTSYDQDGDVWAAFGELTWNITDTLALSAGVRYTYETKEVDASNVVLELDGTPASALTQTLFQSFAVNYTYDDDLSEEDVDSLVRAQYYFNEGLMGYVTASTGSKSGGYNMTVANPDTEPIDFEGEDATTFEAGLKATFLDNRASLTVALYRTEFDDLQVSAFNGVAGFVVGNAAEATAQGFELDGVWRITPYLTLAGGYAYLDAEYDSYDNAPCTVAQGETGCVAQDLTGERLPFAAEHSASLNAQYLYPIARRYELGIGAIVNYSDEVFLQLDADPKDTQDAYTEIDARISLADVTGRWEAALVGRNLSDERTSGTSFDMAVLGGDAHVADLRRPRRFSVEFSIRW